jgi:hypothetical protein
VNFAAITLCVASQRAIPKESVYFVIDSVRKLGHPRMSDVSFSRRTLLHVISKSIRCAALSFIGKGKVFPLEVQLNEFLTSTP